jgi:hypothetical protein
MAALADVGREISATLELSAVLQRIADRAETLLEGTSSAVYLADEDGKTFNAIAALGDVADQVKAQPVIRGNGIIGTLAEEARRKSLTTSPPMAGVSRSRARRRRDHERLLVAPLMGRAGVNGMMAVWRIGPDTRPFTPADLDFLSACRSRRPSPSTTRGCSATCAWHAKRPKAPTRRRAPSSPP